LNTGFAGVNRDMTAGFSGVSRDINCAFNNLNTNMTNGFFGVEKAFCSLQLSDANMLNALTAQNSSLMNALGQVSCQQQAGFKELAQLNNANTDKVLCAIANCQKDAEIAALRNALAHEQRCHSSTQSQLANNSIVSETSRQVLLNLGTLVGGQSNPQTGAAVK
jgi:hypothetical protein